MGIRVANVSKRFGDFQAVDDVSVDIDSGSLVALLGPSGSGKSTLLRLIAGLEHADAGRVWITGEEATDRSVQERQVGFVFQHFALFKHRTVRQNVSFGLELRHWKKEAIRRRVDELLDLVQLKGYGGRYPSQLSGGQRQRVALARALAVQPRVLLLDEPFSALDAKVRKELRAWLRNLHDEMHVTTVIVTHDQEEAMEVADRIVVMNEGHIEQIGTPAEIYDHQPLCDEFCRRRQHARFWCRAGAKAPGRPSEWQLASPRAAGLFPAPRCRGVPAPGRGHGAGPPATLEPYGP
jgi:sulfate transport system ATP-binding protein